MCASKYKKLETKVTKRRKGDDPIAGMLPDIFDAIYVRQYKTCKIGIGFTDESSREG